MPRQLQQQVSAQRAPGEHDKHKWAGEGGSVTDHSSGVLKLLQPADQRKSDVQAV